MELKKLLLNWQILLLLLCILGSIIAINPRPDSEGLVVTSVGDGAFYGKIGTGTIIYSANLVGQESREINTLADLISFQTSAGYLNLNTNKGNKNIRLSGDEAFNLSVEKVQNSNLKFGLDIEGGIKALLQPKVGNRTNNETNVSISEIISILETRINIYGLRQAEFRKLEIGDNELLMVSIAGGTKKEIVELLAREGKFEAKIPMTLKNNSIFKLGKFLSGKNEEFKLKILDNESIKINDEIYTRNETFTLKGIEFNIENLTSDKVALFGLVYTSKDITSVGIPPESNRFGSSGGSGYSFQFGVVVSPKGTGKFAEITQNLKKVVSTTGGSHLSEKIYFYLDNLETDALSIAGDLKGRKVTNPVITGGGVSEEEALKNRDQLKAILKSGNLPVEIEIISIDQLSATLGENYLYLIALAGLMSIFLVSAVIFIRYRSLMISMGVVLTMLSEVILILGFAALTHWNLSTLALAGIVAAIGFGVDDQILIIDETRKKREKYSLKEGLKRAFFMIFGAGATTIFAMLPILMAGFGVYKEIGGFALTVIVGVLAGILITRPAFSKYIEYILAE
ncbi:MAG: MMPL family transporter [Candidatus Aenigmarchaeota archaeon]|nr:MMPL family transporter [Candidatus Aenigmarchaeota archaeon]